MPTNELNNFHNFSKNATHNNNYENKVVQKLIDCLALNDPYLTSEYINMDSRIGIQDMLNNEEIISLVQGKEAIEDNNNQESLELIIIVTDTIKLINKLKLFII